MPTVKYVSDAEATGRVAEIFEELRRNLGVVPNVYRALANNPAVLEAMWQHRRRIMGPGALDPQTKEWLAWATVVMNNSKFAVDIHTSRLKAMGYDSAAIVEALSVINFFVGISTMINGMGGVDLNPEVVAQLEASK